MLTVRGLIQQLQALDPDLPIVRYHYEGGYSGIQKVQILELVDNYYDPEDWWYGDYEQLDYVKNVDTGVYDSSKHSSFKAVFIH